MNDLAKDYRTALRTGGKIDKDSYRRELESGLTLGSALLISIILFLITMVILWMKA